MGVCILRFQTLQPEDPGLDMIMGVVFCSLPSRGNPAHKNFAGDCTVPDFLSDLEAAYWGFVAARFGAEPKPGGGNGVSAEELRVLKKIECLGRDVDADLHWSEGTIRMEVFL
jgi:hypothetical protein